SPLRTTPCPYTTLFRSPCCTRHNYLALYGTIFIFSHFHEYLHLCYYMPCREEVQANNFRPPPLLSFLNAQTPYFLLQKNFIIHSILHGICDGEITNPYKLY